MKKQKNELGRGLGFPYKITLVITSLLAFGMGINLFLNFINFETNYREVVQSRFEVVGSNVKNTIESGLNLGLGLAELKNVQTLMEEIPAKKPDIPVVKVFAPDGSILFDADSEMIGKLVPGAWLLGSLHSKGKVWQLEYGDLVIQGVDLLDSFNEKTGTLVIGYPVTLISDTTGEVSQYLLWVFLVVLVAFHLLTMSLVRLQTRDILKSFKRMGESLFSVKTTGEAVLGEAGSHGALEKEYVAFQSTYRYLKERMRKLHDEADRQISRGAEDAGPDIPSTGR